MKPTSRALVSFAALALTALPSRANFVLVDDMEGADNWTLAENSTPQNNDRGIVADPADGTNQVYRITGFIDVNKSDASLSQDNPGTDPGDVTDGNLLTTDEYGDGKVRLTLTGNPRDFVRALANPADR